MPAPTPRASLCTLALVASVVFAPRSLDAQRPARERQCLPPMPALAPLGGDQPLHRSYTRADSVAPLSCTRGTTRWIRPQLRITARGGAPDIRGAGNAPSVVGTALQLRAGMELRLGDLQLRIAPEIVSAANQDFLIFPGRDSTRSSFASPFYHGDFSADLPLRAGDAAHFRLDAGESGVWWMLPNVVFSATTARPDWGPGVGEGIVLGTSAPGLPRVEINTWRTLGAATIRARWFGGTAVESRFFDANTANDLRSLAGVRLTYERTDWTLGISRTVMDGRGGGPMSAALLPMLATRTDSVIEMLALDLFITNRESGTFAWFEGARQQPLRNFRDLTLMPTEGLAFRVGMSQRLSERDAVKWILSIEAVRLDQPAQRAGRDPQDLYTSPTVIQGWTHRGQPLGSGLGPGGQRQMISLDREGRVWGLGGFVERARWNDDALYREFLAYQNRHDVTVQLGLRAGRMLRTRRIDAAFSIGKRLNYLFQNADFIPGYRSEDRTVSQLTFTLK